MLHLEVLHDWENRMKGKRPIAIDLFSGAGGMSLGFEQAGFDVLLAVEIDGYHVAAHERNFPQSQAICDSINNVTASSIYDKLGSKCEIDLVFGGPPCQGFSHMGSRNAKDERNDLVDEFARVVLELNPKCFVMENVPGMNSGATKPILDAFLKKMQNGGYRITTPIKTLDASDFGVPQKRKRLFVLGVRNDLKGSLDYPIAPPKGQPVAKNVGEAISDLPEMNEYDHLFATDTILYDKDPRSNYELVMRGEEKDPTDFSYPRLWDRTHCTGCQRTRHTPKTIALYEATSPGKIVPGHKLPRLHPEGFCPTLRAGSDSKHGSHTAPRPIHPKSPRTIGVREAARLHGFPDWFVFYPSKWHAYRQIGNAVVPYVAKSVGAQVLKALGVQPTKPRKKLRLNGTFEVPDGAPKTEKRITHLDNYKPVVKHLFEKAWDRSEKKLVKPFFTFADVRRAIDETGANIPWTTKETFLFEISRNRNVKKILAPCLSEGFSIRPVVNHASRIGEFVSKDRTGAIHEKDSIQIKSEDVANAKQIDGSVVVDGSKKSTLFQLLQLIEVRDALWSEMVAETFSLESQEEKSNGTAVASYRYNTAKRGATKSGVALVPDFGASLSKQRIKKLIDDDGASECILIIPVTSKHLLTTRLVRTRTGVRQQIKTVFSLPQ